MKKLTDDELQQMLEKGMQLKSEADPASQTALKTYQMLFDLLDEGPGGSLPYDFETVLNRKMNTTTNKRIALKWYLLAFLGGCVAFALTYALLDTYSVAAGKRYGAMISAWKCPVIFTFACVLITHFLDGLLKDNNFRLFVNKKSMGT